MGAGILIYFMRNIGGVTLRESNIYKSPHAFDPEVLKKTEERDKLYNPTRIDESFRAYTVIDVLQKVYHRSFKEDLSRLIGQVPEFFQKEGNRHPVAGIRLIYCRIIRPESVFDQPLRAFRVDILMNALVQVDEVVRGNANLINRYNVSKEIRLRYCFDFRPCEMTCRLEGIILDERDRLSNTPDAIPMNKYLIPVLRKDDYDEMACRILFDWMPESLGKDIPIDMGELIRRIGLIL